MAPKKKGTAVKLSDFLSDETTGKVDWADDMDDLQLAPLPAGTGGGARRGSDWLSSQPDRGDRERSTFDNDRGFDRGPIRPELPLPTAPPFTAFVGNLSFDVREAEVEDFFAPSKCTSVRMVNGGDGRPKGFGYVEFETLDGLKDALSRTGAQWMGRTVRVSVAEPREARAGGSSVAEEASQWRRAGPLPAMEGPSAAARKPGGFARSDSGASGFDTMMDRSTFGSRFQPATPRELQPPGRRPMAENLEPSVGDTASDWRTGKPTTEALSPTRGPSGSPAGMGPEVGGRGPTRPVSKGDATEIDERFASQDRLGFGSKFVATPPESPAMNKRPGFGFDRRSSNAPPAGPSDEADTWRSAARRPSSNNPSDGGSPASTGPAQRKKLELKPRSIPAEGTETSAAASSSTSNKPNPFGMAKPIDAGEREREIEAKLAAQDKERREEEKKRKEKLRTDREKAQAQAPTGPKADRNRSRGPTSEKGSETSSAPAAETEGIAATSTSPTRSAAGPKKAPPPTGAWTTRKPSGALVSGQQSPSVAATVNGNGLEASANGKEGVEAAEVQKAVESLSVAEK